MLHVYVPKFINSKQFKQGSRYNQLLVQRNKQISWIRRFYKKQYSNELVSDYEYDSVSDTTEKVKGCQTFNELQSVLEQQANQLNDYGLAISVNQCFQIPSSEDVQAIRKELFLFLLQQVNLQVSKWKTATLAHLCNAINLYKIQVPNDVADVFFDELKRRIPQFKMAGLVSVLKAMVNARYRSEDLFIRISLALVERQNEINQHGVANVLWACAKLKFKDQALIKLYLNKFMQNIDEASVHAISQVLFALTLLNYGSDEEISVLYSRICENINQLKLINVEQVLWAMQRRGCYDQNHLQHCLSYIVQNADQLDVRSLESIFYSFAQLNVSDEASTFMLKQKAMENFEQLGGRACANIVYFCATIEDYDKWLVNKVFQGIARQAEHLSVSDSAWCVWSIAKLDHLLKVKQSESKKKVFLRLITKVADVAPTGDLKSSQLLNILAGYRMMEIEDTKILDSISKGLVKNVLKLKSSEISIAMWELALLQYQDELLLLSLSNRFYKLAEEACLSDIARFFVSIGKLQHGSRRDFQPLLERIQFNLSKFETGELQWLFCGVLWMDNGQNLLSDVMNVMKAKEEQFKNFDYLVPMLVELMYTQKLDTAEAKWVYTLVEQVSKKQVMSQPQLTTLVLLGLRSGNAPNLEYLEIIKQQTLKSPKKSLRLDTIRTILVLFMTSGHHDSEFLKDISLFVEIVIDNRKFQDYEVNSIATIAWSLLHLHSLNARLRQKILNLIYNNIDCLENTALRDVTWLCSLCYQGNEKIMERICKKIQISKFEGFYPDLVQDVVWSLSLVKIYNETIFQAAAVNVLTCEGKYEGLNSNPSPNSDSKKNQNHKYTSVQAKQYKVSQLMLMAMAFAKCRHWSVQLFKIVCKRIVNGEKMKLKEVFAWLVATATFNFNMGKAAKLRVQYQLLNQLDAINATTTFSVLRTAVLSGLDSPNLIQRLCAKINTLDENSIQKHEITQLFHAYLVLDSNGKGNLIRDNLREEIFQVGEQQWVQQTNKQLKIATKKLITKEISQILRDLNLEVSLGELTEDQFVGIHIVIRKNNSDREDSSKKNLINLKNNQKIAILVESDFKYAINDENHRLRAGLIQEQLLMHRGWTVITVKTQDFYKLRSLQMQQQHFIQAIRNINH